MSTSTEQMRLLRALSDIELYQQAIDFLNTEVKIKDQLERRPPLPNTQIHGLLNAAQANTYSELKKFIKHQHSGRSWQEKNEHIKIFYEDLEREIGKLPEFAKSQGLIAEDLSTKQNAEEVQKISGLLACEFIQHLAAENLVREKVRSDEEKRRRRESHD